LCENAHSPENSSDEWAFFFLCIKFTSVVTQIAIKSVVKIIIFYLSKSKCTVSALFLHGFKGCNGHSDLQNTTKGAEIAGQKITMLCAKITQTRKFQNQSSQPEGLF
jgi:type IV secretory pathway VirB6-like protein